MSLCRGQDKRQGRYHLIGAEEEDPVVIERVRWLVVAMGVARGTPGGLAIAEIARLDYAVTLTPILPATGWRLVRLDHPVVYVGDPCRSATGRGRLRREPRCRSTSQGFPDCSS